MNYNLLKRTSPDSGHQVAGTGTGRHLCKQMQQNKWYMRENIALVEFIKVCSIDNHNKPVLVCCISVCWYQEGCRWAGTTFGCRGMPRQVPWQWRGWVDIGLILSFRWGRARTRQLFGTNQTHRYGGGLHRNPTTTYLCALFKTRIL